MDPSQQPQQPQQPPLQPQPPIDPRIQQPAPNQGVYGQQFSQPMPGQGGPLPPSANKPGILKLGKKKLIIIIGAASTVLILIVVIAVLASGGDKQPPAQTQDTNENNQQLLEPARALDVEQINNSVSQDISNLSNDKDFPEDQFSDKALGL